ncbi:MAG: hypothetical protein VB111_04805 [Clostridiaceae bacterium]|nr:hypothetical protein [Clostridiaceae bacterium]
MLPKVDFLGCPMSRLIVGDNPVNGHTYIQDIISKDDMLGYYTEDAVLRAMEHSASLGYTAWMPLGNDFMLRVIYHYIQRHDNFRWIFQSYAPIDFAVNLRMMAEVHPLGIYHRGTDTDGLCEAGQYQLIRERIKMIQALGIKAGLGTHVPETMLRAEYENWGCDFYVACLHNTRRREDAAPSAFITGKPKSIQFHMEDRAIMLKAIREVQKPVIAFKLLAGGQIYEDIPASQYAAATKAALRESFDGMKPGDIGAVGCFQRDKDQLCENADIFNSLYGN